MKTWTVLWAVVFGMIVFGCGSLNRADAPVPRRDVVVGVGTNDLASVDVLIATRDGTFTKVGRAASGRPLCFHWTLAGPVGRIRSFDARGAPVTVEFEPYTADAWTWTVSPAEQPRALYGTAKCQWEVR